MLIAARLVHGALDLNQKKKISDLTFLRLPSIEKVLIRNISAFTSMFPESDLEYKLDLLVSAPVAHCHFPNYKL